MASADDNKSPMLSDSSPLALLVHAAAQSEAPKDDPKPSAVASTETSKPVEGNSANTKAVQSQEHKRQLAEAAWRDAVHKEVMQRQALEREAAEREAVERELLHRRAALMGMATTGGPGMQTQEADYMQQLRLEALVQQRRQETLAQLALAQDMGASHEMQALAQAQQLRQVALLRQEMLHGGIPPGYEHLGMHLAGAATEEQLILQQQLEERERMAKLSALGLIPTSATHATLPGANSNSIMKGDASRFLNGSSGRSVKDGSENATVLGDVRNSDPKTMVIPCRARGMPVDHNAKSALFVVPAGIKHGTELECSYFACRNSGIKFRYCTYCQLPVAKRNFCKRHRHEGKIPKGQLPEGGLKDDESDNCTSEEVESDNPKSKAVAKIDAEKMLTKLVDLGVDEVRVSDPKEDAPESHTKESVAERLLMRQKEWDRLLHERPNDEETMTTWVRKVLAVSDIESAAGDSSPLPEETSSQKVNYLQQADDDGSGNHQTPAEAALPGLSGKATNSETPKSSEAKEKPAEDENGLKMAEVSQSADQKEEADLSNGKGIPEASINKTEEEKTEEMGVNTASETNKREHEESDAGSSSSDESVDLRAAKKAKNL